MMSGKIFEMANISKKGQGFLLAKQILESGKAHEKFEEIRNAQGKKSIPKPAKYIHQIKAFTDALKLKCMQYRIDFIEADINEGFKTVLNAYLVKRSKMRI